MKLIKTKTTTPGNNIYTLLITFIAFTSFISSKFQTLFFPYKLSYYAWATCGLSSQSKKNEFSYLTRSRLLLLGEEILVRDFIFEGLFQSEANRPFQVFFLTFDMDQLGKIIIRKRSRVCVCNWSEINPSSMLLLKSSQANFILTSIMRWNKLISLLLLHLGRPQLLMETFVPVHSCPPHLGGGLVQLRVRILYPYPHVTVQGCHGDQWLHPPFTVEWKYT